jgi:2-polyprenyl-6-methoxyphenol hydroxylase-like FAD-dependent oxidoreductase
MSSDADALVVGAGPAGAAAAIWLAAGGWRVILVEQHAYPRQKVCGECISAGGLSLLDELGVGATLRRMAGPELRQVGWMGVGETVIADFPPCTVGPYRYGRAVGRDHLDELLLERARDLGVEILQPAKVRAVHGAPGDFTCVIEARARERFRATAFDIKRTQWRHARVVIDAHGSWEPAPQLTEDAPHRGAREIRRSSDLFAFKASFRDSTLAPGLLPVLALDGGYGGVVVADDGRTTLACCIRRDRLSACRAAMPGAAAGVAVAAFLRGSCPEICEVLDPARLERPWLTVGPIRPGIRVDDGLDTFRVGNAAGETHPLIGEGINMALQSASLLARHLLQHPAVVMDLRRTQELNRRYAAAWRIAFNPRLRYAAGYAQMAMRPALSAPAHAMLRRWPRLLTRAARWAGKARYSVVQLQ